MTLPRPFSLEQHNRIARAEQVKRLLYIAGVTTDELIDQLILEGRLGIVNTSVMVFKLEAMIDADGYHDALERSMAAKLGATLRNNLAIAWTLHDDPMRPEARAIKTGSVCVLMGGNDENTDDRRAKELQRLRGSPADDDGRGPSDA